MKFEPFMCCKTVKTIKTMSSSRTSAPLNKDKSAPASGHRGHQDKPAPVSNHRGHLEDAASSTQQGEEKLKFKQPTRSSAKGTQLREAVMPPLMGPVFRSHTSPVTKNTTTLAQTNQSLHLVSASGPSAAAAIALTGVSSPRVLPVAEIPLCANGCGSPSTDACGGCRRVAYCSQECLAAHWEAGHDAMCAVSEVESQPSHSAQPAAAASSRRSAPEVESHSSQPATAASSRRPAFDPRRLCPHVWKGKPCPNTSDPEARCCVEGAHKLICAHFTHRRGDRCKNGKNCPFIHPGKVTEAGDCAAAAARWKEICAERADSRPASRPASRHALRPCASRPRETPPCPGGPTLRIP